MSGVRDYSDKEIEDIEDLAELYNEAEEIGQLNLSMNRLTVLPETIEMFSNLKVLDLSRNQLESIKHLSLCVSLQTLNLSGNVLKSISEGLFNLKCLTHLDLSYNQLTVNNFMINSFRFNKMLKSLSLKGNPGYDFNNTKFNCLETLLQLEVLDEVVIFKKAKKTIDMGLTCNFKGTNGQNVPIKTIKDYIKFKKEEIDKPQTVKNINAKKVVLPEQKPQNKLRGYYYFSNMIIDK
jgi:hypothetical protein